jgi:hypothetical protein
MYIFDLFSIFRVIVSVLLLAGNVPAASLAGGGGFSCRKGSKVFFQGTFCQDTMPRLRETAC